MTCDRCRKETFGSVGSMFNMQVICFECKDKEEAHPDYQRARDTELEAVKRGEMNFAGIGLPSDLR